MPWWLVCWPCQHDHNVILWQYWHQDSQYYFVTNKIVLLQVGSLTQNLAHTVYSVDHIQFVYVRNNIDFSLVTNKPASMDTETFIELPQGTMTTHNSSGNNVITNFLGLDNITTYTKAAANLADLKFVQSTATLDFERTNNAYRNDILNINRVFSETKLFKTLCPGILNRTSEAIGNIKQCYTDTHGNISYWVSLREN